MRYALVMVLGGIVPLYALENTQTRDQIKTTMENFKVAQQNAQASIRQRVQQAQKQLQFAGGVQKPATGPLVRTVVTPTTAPQLPTATIVPPPPTPRPAPAEVIPASLPEFQPASTTSPEGTLLPQIAQEPVETITPLTRPTKPAERPLPPLPTAQPAERPLPPIPTEQPAAHIPEFEPLPPPTEEELSHMVPPVPALNELPAPAIPPRQDKTLLEEIRAGKQLRPVQQGPAASPTTPTDSRGKLIEEIQQGKKLRPVSAEPRKEYRSDIYKLFEGEQAGRTFEMARQKELEKVQEQAGAQDWSEWE